MEAKKQPNCADWDIYSDLVYGWRVTNWPTMIDEGGDEVTDEEKLEKLEAELDEEKRQQWKICGDWIFKQWMESRAHPGSRPRAWWRFSAPEQPKFLYWGKLQFVPENIGRGNHYCMVPVDENAPGARTVYESEADCLARLGLLENWERDQLLQWEMLRGQPGGDEDQR